MVEQVERSALYVPFSHHLRSSAATGVKGVLFNDPGDAGQVLYRELRHLMVPLMIHDPEDPSSGPTAAQASSQPQL